MDASLGYASLRTAEPLTVGDGISPQQQSSGNALPPTTFDTSDQPLRPVREYDDGFSSSICDLFASPQDRTSCCALVCCGTFLEDRNRYVLTGELPAPWWKRILAGIGVAILTIVAMAVVPGGGYWMILAFCAVGVDAARKRVPLRLRIMRDMVAARTNNNNNNNGQTSVIGMTDNCGCFRPKRAHRMCGCLQNDRINTFRQVSEEEAYDPAREEANRDACTVLWQSLALFCCGCCGCWCNCWGVCATAQEHRELRKQLPRESFLADYITMQPFADYYAAIQDVRTRMDFSFWSHIKAISLLSRKILWLFCGLLAAISVIIFLHGNFPVARIVVVLATMGQALAVLYVVYWRKHRFDLSLDAVIKLFGAGFVFAVGVAMITETILSIVGGVIFYITVIFELVEDGADSYPSNDSLHIAQMFAKKHILTFLLYAAFNSFVVAGLVEELAKYFCFWMVEHPDYPDDRDDDGQATREKGLHATAAALTVGMVATATGFACAENFLYVFGEGLSLSGGRFPGVSASCLR
jgi:RsiW-degrading membrane proteinase PrsW (M82 family)